MPQPTQSLFVDDGVCLAYDDNGDRDAAPVVLLHGYTDSRRTWADLVGHLVDGHRVLAVDLPGHGESDRVPATISYSQVVDRLAAFCEAVARPPSALIGHSFGGVIAAWLAATRPDLVRGVLLLDPPLFGAPRDITDLFSVLRETLASVQAADHPHEAATAMLASAPSMTGGGTMAEALGPERTERLAYAWTKVDLDLVAAGADSTGSEDPFQLEAPITCPITVIRADPACWGAAFTTEQQERMRSLAPHADFLVAAGASHNIHIDRPEWLARQVAAFLERL